MNEKRKTIRLSVDIPVKIRFNGVTMPGKSRNLSCGGIFVQMPKASPDEGKCELVLTLPDGRPPLVVNSQVVWTKPEKRRKGKRAEPSAYHEVEAPPAPVEPSEPAPAESAPAGESENGAGVEFKNLDPEQKARINAFLERTMRENLH